VLDGSTVYMPLDRKPKRVAASRLKRVRNILENPRVALVADVYEEDWSKLGFVLLHGTARVLSEGVEHGHATGLLQNRYRQYRDMDLETQPLIAIDVDSAVPWGQLTTP
jgi:PPOX class probable F420-dependent enzyme